MSSASTENGGKTVPHVAIVGAGLAGIITAIQLKRRFGFENFTASPNLYLLLLYHVLRASFRLRIYEKASAVGGTWRDNTYPGCGSDVPGHWYSVSTDLNPNWDSYYAGQPELQAYWVNLWRKYQLDERTRLNTEVLGSVWSNDTQSYTISLRNTQTKEEESVEAKIVVYAIGGFQDAFYPKDILGRENFKGEVFHSANWRHDVDLSGKRVGVIGNGCSAAQFVPEISKDPSTQVINFCRTPQWYVPKLTFRYPPWVKWIFAHLPFIMRLHRNWIMARSDLNFMLFKKTNARYITFVRGLLIKYIKAKAPKEEWKNLIPNYTPGCKRMIVDPGYLACLKQPNVKLNWDGIDTVVEDGIKVKTGETAPLDVIIFGTGYSIEAASLRVTGSRGQTVHEYFAEKGAPQAYLGTCMPGFPNLFTLLGPNVATGHASVIFSNEAQINLALNLMQPVLEGKAQSFEITDKATDEYNDWLQKKLSDSVWTECISYYQAGRGNKSKIVATFPGPVTLFWWFCRHPKWELFKAVGAEKFEREERGRKLRNRISALLAVAAIVVGVWRVGSRS